MQWPPAIRNYMRKVRSKYQLVIGYFSITDSKILKYKYMTCAEKTKNTYVTPYKYSHHFHTLAFFQSSVLIPFSSKYHMYVETYKGKGNTRINGGGDMLIF